MKGKKVSLVENEKSKSNDTLFKRSPQKKRSKTTNKAPAQTNLLQKNSDFLKNHLNTFKVCNLQSGDSGEHYFKKSLRNYQKPLSESKLKWLSSSASEKSENNRTRITSSKIKFSDNTPREELDLETKLTESETSFSSYYSDSSSSLITILEPETMGEEGDGRGMFYDEGEDEIDQMVNEVADEMDRVLEENPELRDAVYDSQAEDAALAEQYVEPSHDSDISDERTINKSKEATNVLSFTIPNDNAGILKKLEDVEAAALETSKLMNELKERVGELANKPKMTNEESRELMEKNRLLQELMGQFEDQTKLIQLLMERIDRGSGESSESSDLTEPSTMVQQKKLPEDSLPKVIICGATEDNMPKILICDVEKNKRDKKSSLTLPASEDLTPSQIARRMCGSHINPQDADLLGKTMMPKIGNRPCDISCKKEKMGLENTDLEAKRIIPQFAKRLCDSYSMQEKLAIENQILEGKRYQLQEDVLHKDQTVESLQRKLCGVQAELRVVLNEKNNLSNQLKGKRSKRKMSCGGGGKRTICPADVENRLMEYSNNTQLLEQQMGQMEMEIRNLHCELACVQKERQQLRMRCGPQPKPPCPAPCAPRPCEQQLRELREQYNRLQDDFKAKLTEVAGLRADTERWKSAATLAEEAKRAVEDKLRDFDKNMKTVSLDMRTIQNSKEMVLEKDQQLNVAKARFREAQDELEELRALIQDQAAQLEDYRNKYLQAQQQVDEQRRQIDLMELENSRIAEQVNIEISRVKNNFQDKLQELMPLPDMLKATQVKLQESQQLHLLAEKNNETLLRENHSQREKIQALQCQLDKFMDDAASGADSQGQMMSKVDDCERRINDLQQDNEKLRTDLIRMEELAEQNEKRVQEKMHEIAQLMSQLDMVREESARQVARTKDRCETVRRSMQCQISELERQLAQSRASACSAQKERDDIRQKMQMQITSLNENFEESQNRVRALQTHVNYLKTSYTNIMQGGEGGAPPMQILQDDNDPCNCTSANNSY